MYLNINTIKVNMTKSLVSSPKQLHLQGNNQGGANV